MREFGFEQSKQFKVSEVAGTRGNIRHEIDLAWDVIMEWGVSIMTLMDGLESEEERIWAHCGCRPFPLPVYCCGVVITVVNGNILQIDHLAEDIVMCH
jgi:hypothetical protein